MFGSFGYLVWCCNVVCLVVRVFVFGALCCLLIVCLRLVVVLMNVGCLIGLNVVCV